MICKFTPISDGDFPHLDELFPNRGTFNSPPPGWRRAAETDVLRGPKGTWGPIATEFRQFPTEPGGRYRDISLEYFFDRTGVGWAVDHENHVFEWFTFGCDDPNHTVHRCTACGHSAHFDSSG